MSLYRKLLTSSSSHPKLGTPGSKRRLLPSIYKRGTIEAAAETDFGKVGARDRQALLKNVGQETKALLLHDLKHTQHVYRHQPAKGCFSFETNEVLSTLSPDQQKSVRAAMHYYYGSKMSENFASIDLSRDTLLGSQSTLLGPTTGLINWGGSTDYSFDKQSIQSLNAQLKGTGLRLRLDDIELPVMTRAAFEALLQTPIPPEVIALKGKYDLSYDALLKMVTPRNREAIYTTFGISKEQFDSAELEPLREFLDGFKGQLKRLNGTAFMCEVLGNMALKTVSVPVVDVDGVVLPAARFFGIAGVQAACDAHIIRQRDGQEGQLVTEVLHGFRNVTDYSSDTDYELDVNFPFKLPDGQTHTERATPGGLLHVMKQRVSNMVKQEIGEEAFAAQAFLTDEQLSEYGPIVAELSGSGTKVFEESEGGKYLTLDVEEVRKLLASKKNVNAGEEAFLELLEHAVDEYNPIKHTVDLVVNQLVVDVLLNTGTLFNPGDERGTRYSVPISTCYATVVDTKLPVGERLMALQSPSSGASVAKARAVATAGFDADVASTLSKVSELARSKSPVAKIAQCVQGALQAPLDQFLAAQSRTGDDATGKAGFYEYEPDQFWSSHGKMLMHSMLKLCVAGQLVLTPKLRAQAEKLGYSQSLLGRIVESNSR